MDLPQPGARAMNKDIAQVTFFSIAFNLSERILMIPASFGTSTMMALVRPRPGAFKRHLHRAGICQDTEK